MPGSKEVFLLNAGRVYFSKEIGIFISTDSFNEISDKRHSSFIDPSIPAVGPEAGCGFNTES